MILAALGFAGISLGFAVAAMRRGRAVVEVKADYFVDFDGQMTVGQLRRFLEANDESTPVWTFSPTAAVACDAAYVCRLQDQRCVVLGTRMVQ